jgi:hypothetical protein
VWASSDVKIKNSFKSELGIGAVLQFENLGLKIAILLQSFGFLQSGTVK